MIIYNVTVKVQYEIHRQWIDWMKEIHIPEVMDTGMFVSHRMCRLIDPVDDDGFTYAMQYFANDINKIKRYKNEYAKELQGRLPDQFKGRVVAFRTLLKIVE